MLLRKPLSRPLLVPRPAGRRGRSTAWRVLGRSAFANATRVARLSYLQTPSLEQTDSGLRQSDAIAQGTLQSPSPTLVSQAPSSKPVSPQSALAVQGLPDWL
jgi:hypothetical protein